MRPARSLAISRSPMPERRVSCSASTPWLPWQAMKHFGERTIRYLIGRDVFVSYAHHDGTLYAANLARQLGSLGLSCFLDQFSSEPESTIPRRVLSQLRRASMLVVVGSDAALQSKAVDQE